MLYCRYERQGQVGWGVVEEHRVWAITPEASPPFKRTGESWPLNDLRLLAPCEPSKIVAVGLNYREHITEFGREEIPQEPVLFLKPPSAVIGPGDPIRIPRGGEPVDYEAELAVVIGKSGRHIPVSQAADFVLGYTAFNDVTARALQKKDGQWTRAKSFDTFAPIGPWIAAGMPPKKLRVEAHLNGRTVQAGSSEQMIFGVPELVAFVSSVMTLHPGDVIATGTPQGVGPIQAGDVVEIFVEGVGMLRNPVVAEK
jgi:2-keto-4-pentenoate hydratase/2-oxohepta-3-ene-1,7-dioic acid hydratase in catechol pathway